MNLGEKILELRKKVGLSQEQLGERINVTRQTISNWELGETQPNPEQLKLLSKELNISIDELLDNDIKNILVEKVSNTEKLAGVVLKILKWLGIVFCIILVIDIMSFFIFAFIKDSEVTSNSVSEVEISCTLEEKDYLITIGSDGYFNCSNCDKELQKEFKTNYVDYNDVNKSADDIIKYFEDNNGYCE